MKVKNIMFSGFAAAILMGVGAAHAVVANPVTLADQGYVDAKINLVAGQKEAVANKMNATTAAAATLDALAADEDNYPSVAAAVEIADKKAKAVVKDVNEAAGDLATLKGNVDNLMKKVDTEGNVAAAIAGALTGAKEYANGLATNYDAAGAADDALTEAKAYTDTKVGDLGEAGNVVAYVEAKATAAKDAAVAAANTAAETAIANSGHALATDVARDYETKADATSKLAEAKKYTDDEIAELNVSQYAKTADVTATYETKTDAATQYATFETKTDASAQYATFETKTDASSKLAEAKKYTDDEIAELNVSQYAVAETVNNELANKLDSSALTANGTYMVTKTDNGIEYTAVTVATAADAVTE